MSRHHSSLPSVVCEDIFDTSAVTSHVPYQEDIDGFLASPIPDGSNAPNQQVKRNNGQKQLNHNQSNSPSHQVVFHSDDSDGSEDEYPNCDELDIFSPRVPPDDSVEAIRLTLIDVPNLSLAALSQQAEEEYDSHPRPALDRDGELQHSLLRLAASASVSASPRHSPFVPAFVPQLPLEIAHSLQDHPCRRSVKASAPPEPLHKKSYSSGDVVFAGHFHHNSTGSAGSSSKMLTRGIVTRVPDGIDTDRYDANQGPRSRPLKRPVPLQSQSASTSSAGSPFTLPRIHRGHTKSSEPEADMDRSICINGLFDFSQPMPHTGDATPVTSATSFTSTHAKTLSQPHTSVSTPISPAVSMSTIRQSGKSTEIGQGVTRSAKLLSRQLTEFQSRIIEAHQKEESQLAAAAAASEQQTPDDDINNSSVSSSGSIHSNSLGADGHMTTSGLLLGSPPVPKNGGRHRRQGSSSLDSNDFAKQVVHARHHPQLLPNRSHIVLQRNRSVDRIALAGHEHAAASSAAPLMPPDSSSSSFAASLRSSYNSHAPFHASSPQSSLQSSLPISAEESRRSSQELMRLHSQSIGSSSSSGFTSPQALPRRVGLAPLTHLRNSDHELSGLGFPKSLHSPPPLSAGSSASASLTPSDSFQMMASEPHTASPGEPVLPLEDTYRASTSRKGRRLVVEKDWLQQQQQQQQSLSRALSAKVFPHLPSLVVKDSPVTSPVVRSPTARTQSDHRSMFE